MSWSHPSSTAFVTVFCSKSSSSIAERDMYIPFTEVLNGALGALSGIQVDGLPEFKAHVVFVPCNKLIGSDRELPGSSFKPDVALMSIQDAREFYQLDQLDTPESFQSISKISGKSAPRFPSWNHILSAVELKRKSSVSQAPLGAFDRQDKQGDFTRDVDQRLDEGLDDSQPTTCKLVWCHRSAC